MERRVAEQPKSVNSANARRRVPTGRVDHDILPLPAHLLGKRILLVDDEPDVLATLALILSGRGFEVAMARSGLEALQCADAHRPDLIITDYTMRGYFPALC